MIDWTDSATLPPADLVEQLAELRRETVMRRKLYGGFIRGGKLSEARARQQLHRLAGAVSTLESAIEAERTLAIVMELDTPGDLRRCTCPYCPGIGQAEEADELVAEQLVGT